ncbi:MAG: hypothetical protein ABS81_20065 [Pseudonocardia sp. SCN 72-86]|nr:MAG: hypothetical protein ABS81_20065 [Pseudonocardia sp. SCN 72-86]
MSRRPVPRRRSADVVRAHGLRTRDGARLVRPDTGEVRADDGTLLHDVHAYVGDGPLRRRPPGGGPHPRAR